jgi:hypothetical protein
LLACLLLLQLQLLLFLVGVNDFCFVFFSFFGGEELKEEMLKTAGSQQQQQQQQQQEHLRQIPVPRTRSLSSTVFDPILYIYTHQQLLLLLLLLSVMTSVNGISFFLLLF